MVRKLEASLVQKLKERAAKNGVSAEEEHRRILNEAMNGGGDSKPKMSFKEFLMYGCGTDVDAEFSRIEGTIRDVDLSD